MALKRIAIPEPGQHPSNEWAEAQANPSEYYPAVVPYVEKPNGSKFVVRFTLQMMTYLDSIQVDAEASKQLRRIAGGYFNRNNNQQFIEHDYPTQNYVPLAWVGDGPRGEYVTSVTNLVNVIDRRNGYSRIEVFPEGTIPDVSYEEMPWMFNRFTSIKVGDNQLGYAMDSRGVTIPLWAREEAWINDDWLEDPVSVPNPPPVPPEREPVYNQDLINAIYFMLQQKDIPANEVWGYVVALGLEHLAVPRENRSKEIVPQ